MYTIASGIIFAFILLASAILFRSMPTQPGEGPQRKKAVLVGVLIGASMLAFVATLASPLFHAIPHSIVALVERVMPKQPDALRHLFRYQPTAEIFHAGAP